MFQTAKGTKTAPSGTFITILYIVDNRVWNIQSTLGNGPSLAQESRQLALPMQSSGFVSPSNAGTSHEDIGDRASARQGLECALNLVTIAIRC
eukprot:scaffold443_cov177-Amphora_coffeaeformis.AAC.9